MTSACIITPDILGPVKNGGIGTHAFYLASFLRQKKKQPVTILFTGPIESHSVSHWENYYKDKLDIKFVDISQLEPSFKGIINGGRVTLVDSLNIYNWLKQQAFEVCYFQEWRANGFVSIQAKRTGIALQNTVLTCMTHSSSEWVREGTQTFPRCGIDELILDFMERYCVENADIVLSPSKYMLEWASNSGWLLPNEQKILPYLLSLPTLKQTDQNSENSPDVIFFGRLETRKGLEMFIESLKVIYPTFKKNSSRISLLFLGKVGLSMQGDSGKVISQSLKEYSDVYTFRIVSDKNHEEALSILASYRKSLIVIPSLVDNFPYTVLECLELNLNIIAAKTGGIPEMFTDDNHLFLPNSKALSEKILDFVFGNLESTVKKFSAEKSEEEWSRFYDELAVRKSGYKVRNRVANPSVELDAQTLISVCVPYFNCGEYLSELLQSLEAQTYQNFELIIVNDGSTDNFSQEIFFQKKELCAERNWKFLSKENGGIGHTRNFAASHAQGKYIVFVDADNVAEPSMLQIMLDGMRASDADCLSTYCRAFRSIHGAFSKEYAYAYTPVGACKEAGIYENVFGDANFIVRSDVFRKLGGFREDRDTSCEDWEFLALLTLSGFTLDVIPEYLFLYRHIDNSFSRSTSLHKNHMRAIRPYIQKLAVWEGKMLVASIGTMQHYGLSQNEVSKLLSAQGLGIIPKLYHVLRHWYRHLSGGGSENKRPNLIESFFIRARLLIVKQ